MRLLLDTHVFLWLQTTPARVGAIVDTLALDTTELLLSPASSWEIAIKWSLGKLPLPEPPAAYVPEAMRIARVRSLAITHSHTLAVADLPDHHRDPFDRVLIAQSMVESIRLVTADPLMRRYDANLLWVGTD